MSDADQLFKALADPGRRKLMDRLHAHDYVTYIRTTPARLWDALTDPWFVRLYWFEATVECGWKKGSAWKMSRPDGTLTDTGAKPSVDQKAHPWMRPRRGQRKYLILLKSPWCGSCEYSVWCCVYSE